MKKSLLISLLIPFQFTLYAQEVATQEKVTGSRKQLVQEVLMLRRELSDLKRSIELEKIPLSDTITVNDTLNFGTLYDGSRNYIDEAAFPVNTDSLLSIFYLQRSLHHNSQNEFMDFDIDSLNVVADLPDSVYISRLIALNSFITIPYSPVVRNHIVRYTQKMPKIISTILGLATYYMPIFEEIFDQHDLPLELKAVAIIESALNPIAVSRAKARGMWQFMHRTALQYGLTITSYVDERYDPIASGHAAAKYLKDAYNVYGDWALAISSYNCGVGNVNKAIRRAGSNAFWDIYPFLPPETRGYVPAFVAALYTLTYYKDHGIKPLSIEMPAHIDTFYVAKNVHFEQIAKFTNISLDELRDLNPQYLRDFIPGKPFILRLPHNYTPLFVENEQEIYSYNETAYFNPVLIAKSTTTTANRNYLVHTVKSGETLGGIALRYRVKVADIQYWNNIKGTLIRTGQKLSIYSSAAAASSSAAAASSGTTSSSSAAASASRGSTSSSSSAAASGGSTSSASSSSAATSSSGNSTSSSSAAAASSSSTSNNSFQWHTVVKGDSLWDIARTYNISLNDLMELNGLNKNSKIIPGNRLKIRKL